MRSTVLVSCQCLGGGLVQSIVDLVSELNQLDDDAPDRLRYRTHQAQEAESTFELAKSFPEPTPLLVVDTQERFEAIYVEHLALREFEDDWNFGSHLVREADHWGQQVAYREPDADK